MDTKEGKGRWGESGDWGWHIYTIDAPYNSLCFTHGINVPDAGKDWGQKEKRAIRGWDGWMAFPKESTWTWANCGRCWGTVITWSAVAPGVPKSQRRLGDWQQQQQNGTERRWQPAVQCRQCQEEIADRSSLCGADSAERRAPIRARCAVQTVPRSVLTALWWPEWEEIREKGVTGVHMTGLLCCAVETNTALESSACGRNRALRVSFLGRILPALGSFGPKWTNVSIDQNMSFLSPKFKSSGNFRECFWLSWLGEGAFCGQRCCL